MVTYCIHRLIDSERLVELQEELSKIDLEVIYIEPEPINNDMKETDWFNKNMDSLRRTTINIIKTAKETGQRYVTIMEDDCKFDLDAWNHFKSKELPPFFDFVHLNVTGRQRFGITRVNDVFIPVVGNCCQFYIINDQVYDRYLELLNKHKLPIDEVTRQIHKERKRSFAVEPLPVYHEAGKYSTLKGKNVNY
jgi:hypothetical protein